MQGGDKVGEKKSIQLWSNRAKPLARVWLCGQCGAKVYCGHYAEKPDYRCLCGKYAWQNYAGYPLNRQILEKLASPSLLGAGEP